MQSHRLLVLGVHAVNVDIETINRFYSMKSMVEADRFPPTIHRQLEGGPQRQLLIFMWSSLFFFSLSLSFKAAYTSGPAWTLNP
jgi:hypothetical protein